MSTLVPAGKPSTNRIGLDDPGKTRRRVSPTPCSRVVSVQRSAGSLKRTDEVVVVKEVNRRVIVEVGGLSGRAGTTLEARHKVVIVEEVDGRVPVEVGGARRGNLRECDVVPEDHARTRRRIKPEASDGDLDVIGVWRKSSNILL